MNFVEFNILLKVIINIIYTFCADTTQKRKRKTKYRQLPLTAIY